MKMKQKSIALIVFLLISIIGGYPIGAPRASAAEPWQDAYAEFLNNPGNYYNENYGTVGNVFTLYDIDQDGIPELFTLKNICSYKNQLIVTSVNSGWASTPADTSIFGVFVEQAPGARVLGISYCTISNNQISFKSIWESGFYGDEEDKIIDASLYAESIKSTRLAYYEINAANIQKYIYGTTTPSVTTTPHYFATALEEFFAGATGYTCAVLADLDGDGIEELVAIKELVFPYKDYDPINFSVGIFNETNKSVYFDEHYSTFKDSASVYVSDNNYLIMHRAGGSPETSCIVLEYAAGKANNKIELITDAGEGVLQYYQKRIEIPWDDYYQNRIEIQLDEYNEKCETYGVNKEKKSLYGEGAITDDTAKILAMTATSTASAATPALTAIPTASTVFVNGKNVSFDAYNIEGSNYFKLRDLAYVLSGTPKQFDVGWDSANNAITLISNKPYTPVGGEMSGSNSGNKIPTPTNSKIYLDGNEVSFTAYNINGNNYFKLRDIGKAFNFGVDWDSANNAIIINTAMPYVEP